MRIIRFVSESGDILHGEAGPSVAGGDQVAVLEGSIQSGFRLTRRRARIRKLLAPLVPCDIICIGRNYRPGLGDAAPDKNRSNLGEDDAGGAPTFDDPNLEVFLKPSTSLQNPFDPICIPNFPGIDPHLDCEGELAVVIGTLARHASQTHATEHIFGYTIANDVTARHFQTPAGPPLWMRGKGFDTFCPLGPAIMTRDEIADPNNLAIRTIVNGQMAREGNTGQMIRTVPQIIAALSRHMTLKPGAVILTGAPSTSNNRSLRTGDLTIIEVDLLGQLQNPIV
jgi:2-keto-4-pentenoate hydratase/2-oxohepta-3-ene-1,7-dioic acid hydratase in catechol pathway